MKPTKTITGKLPWTDKESWLFPADDTRTDRSFREGPGDLDTAIPMLLPHLTGRRTCIQAGACLGIWPLRLAQFFDRVISFEPEPTNFHCAVANTAHIDNVELYEASLGSDPSMTVRMRLDKGEVGNSGAYYVVAGAGDIPTVAIDDMGLVDVDLIYLDIEGYEATALIGAAETIRHCRPVIGVEDKRLHLRREQTSATDLLVNEFGYRSIGRPFSLDEIFVPR